MLLRHLSIDVISIAHGDGRILRVTCFKSLICSRTLTADADSTESGIGPDDDYDSPGPSNHLDF